MSSAILRAALVTLAASTAAAPVRSRELAPAAVELEDAGQAPRRILRYDLHAHASVLDLVVQRGRLLLRGILESEETYTPPVATLWELGDVHRDAASDTTQFTLTLALGRVLPDEKATDTLRDALAATLRAAVGRRLEASADDRGRLARIDAPAGSDSDAPALLPELEDAIAARLLLPLPEEPVGVGARWRVVCTSRIGSLEAVTEERRVFLRSLDGERIAVRIASSFRASSGRAGTLHGEEVRIANVEGAGSGDAVYALTDVVPVRADQSWKVDADLFATSPPDAAGGGDAPREARYHVAYEGRELLRVPDARELEPPAQSR
jgi:hypothetical protein